MGGDQGTLAGPDLTQGVALADIADGGMLLGHAQGEAVLVARRGDELFAMGATCTHYSGPLAEGLMVGETVRCPWHHACFSLRTGEALRAPALNPVSCWKVERREGRVVVTEKIDRAPLAMTPNPVPRSLPSPASIGIIGAGAAGSAAAEMLRRQGYDGPITMVDPDPGAPYDRPNLSKDYLAGNAPEEWIPLRPDDFYEQHGIELVRARVTALDARGKRITLDAGGERRFDRLLLAVGAEPIHLELPGADQPHVHYLRSLADSRSIIENAKRAKRAVVVGASFIGLEVAASLRARDLEVHVVALDAIPFERILGRELGELIRRTHEKHGVVFHLENTVTSIDARTVTLRSGGALDADLVVLGVGVRPRLSLAEEAGLTMDRGVSVNEFLETSAPGIYAAGDLARWPDPHTGDRIRVEHWVVAQRMGQAAALNLLGGRVPFAAVPFFWSQHYDMAINYVGHAARWDRIEIIGNLDQSDGVAAYHVGDKIPAVASIFRDGESLKAEAAMERNDWHAVQAAVLGR